MEFNWADPRKNKRVDSVMMAKAEASRVKRLTSVKSTVSNQLNPAVEHKLKTLKKKKSPEVTDERPSSRLHQREFDLGSSNNNSSTSSSSSTSNHSFYNECLPPAARPKQSIFDSFDVHAAADGLFHPASNVQAFAEHDARYAAVARDIDSGRGSTASSKSSDKRLPPLSGHSDRSERLASRSESRLPTSSSSSSASSSYRSLTGLLGNRSDGDLHAPRRADIVPASADRSAMELLEELEHDGDDDDDGYDAEAEPQAPSPKPEKVSSMHKKAPSKRGSSNNDSDHHHDVPPRELDLTQQFAKLKSLIKTNREKDGTAGNERKAARGPEVEEDGDGTQHAAVAEKKKLTAVAIARKETKPLSHPATDNTTTGGAAKKQLSSTSSTTTDAGASTSKSSALPVVVRKHKAKTTATTTTNSELKSRNGVSLSDLKEEHRAALAMLQELGGPLDEHEDATNTKPKASRHARGTAASLSSESSTTNSRVGSSKPTKRSVEASATQVTRDMIAATRPSGSADRSSRLVEKLRARIPSAGRDQPTQHEGSDALHVALESGEKAMQTRRDVAEQKQAAKDDDQQHDAEANEQLWKRYGGDDEQEEDEDEDDDPSAELYDDEGFEG